MLQSISCSRNAMTLPFHCSFKISWFLFLQQLTYLRKTQKFALCENFPLYSRCCYHVIHHTCMSPFVPLRLCLPLASNCLLTVQHKCCIGVWLDSSPHRCGVWPVRLAIGSFRKTGKGCLNRCIKFDHTHLLSITPPTNLACAHAHCVVIIGTIRQRFV